MQPTPAAGASGGVRSQAKNQAFPSFLNSPGISEMSRPGIYTFASCPVKMLRKKFFLVFCEFYTEGSTGFPGGRPVRLSHASGTKMAETLTFLREFRSLEAGPAAHPGLQRSRPLEAGNFFGSFREFLRSFGELRSVSCAPGAGRPAPGLIHSLSTT